MRVLGALLAVVAGILVAGCGGGDDGGDRLSTDEFIAQADAICSETNAAIEALREPASLEEAAEFADAAVVLSRDALDRLQALRPPEEIEARVNEAYDLLAEQAALGEQLAEAAAEGDEARIAEIGAQIDPLDNEADAIAQEIGLTECGQN